MKTRLKILLLIDGILMVADSMLLPMYAIFIEERVGGDLLDAGVAMALFYVTVGAITVLFGRVETHSRNPKVFLFLGMALEVMGYFGYVGATSPWHVFAAEVVFGISSAAYSPVWDALYMRAVSRKHEEEEWSYYEATKYFSGALGMVLGTAIAQFLGFNTLLSVLVGLSVFDALFAYYMLK